MKQTRIAVEVSVESISQVKGIKHEAKSELVNGKGKSRFSLELPVSCGDAASTAIDILLTQLSTVVTEALVSLDEDYNANSERIDKVEDERLKVEAEAAAKKDEPPKA